MKKPKIHLNKSTGDLVLTWYKDREKLVAYTRGPFWVDNTCQPAEFTARSDDLRSIVKDFFKKKGNK